MIGFVIIISPIICTKIGHNAGVSRANFRAAKNFASVGIVNGMGKGMSDMVIETNKKMN